MADDSHHIDIPDSATPGNVVKLPETPHWQSIGEAAKRVVEAVRKMREARDE